MKNFDKSMQDHQLAWRSKHIESDEKGPWGKDTYEWILPLRLWEEGLWSGIRSGTSNPLAKYLDDAKVKKHEGVHNLKSSWTHCANLYFPFGASDKGKSLLAGFLGAFVSPAIESISDLQLEYEDEDHNLKPSQLLGETGGGKGFSQTSPDLGILVNGGRGLLLTENKLLEHHFYPCSGYKAKDSDKHPRATDKECCNNPLAGRNAATECQLLAWKRKYWDYLEPVMNESRFRDLKCCPASRDGFQLMRQQALAEGIAQSGNYDFVISAVALDLRNEKLRTCMTSAGIADVREWGTLFNGKAKFAVWDHQQWVTWVQEHNTAGEWDNWLEWVKSRYGYA